MRCPRPHPHPRLVRANAAASRTHPRARLALLRPFTAERASEQTAARAAVTCPRRFQPPRERDATTSARRGEGERGTRRGEGDKGGVRDSPRVEAWQGLSTNQTRAGARPRGPSTPRCFSGETPLPHTHSLSPTAARVRRALPLPASAPGARAADRACAGAQQPGAGDPTAPRPAARVRRLRPRCRPAATFSSGSLTSCAAQAVARQPCREPQRQGLAKANLAAGQPAGICRQQEVETLVVRFSGDSPSADGIRSTLP
ncbi:transcriptional regulatory protein AlgP-like [Dermochelys coriacea]|uniref:transcriptional regulatory protein AlgP-like n=1 Tax=Dermochelys coriacea TaxID=27794 RepID=UPI001CA89196|nr:transcriptional regulatory protein AlgP-like [Dermochelys coriacea]